jgi:hypothetical protein
MLRHLFRHVAPFTILAGCLLLAIAGGMRAATAAPPTAIGAATPSPTSRLTRFDNYGTFTLVPQSDSPQGCLAAAALVCVGRITGTQTSSTLFHGSGRITGTFTIDFTRPAASAVGVCFAEIIVGTVHAGRGEYDFEEQGPLCIPNAAEGIGAGYLSQSGTGVLAGRSGAFEHLFGSTNISIGTNPAGLTLYRESGVVSGVPPLR